MEKNETLDLTIDRLSNDGNGVARSAEGRVVFVPRSAPGDVARVRIVKVQKTHAFGILEELVTPSPLRCDNRCTSFPQCGGCSFRHLTYEAECAAKADFVRDALRRIGGLDLEVAPTLTGPDTDRYRNKVLLPVFEEDGKLTVGFFAARSHRPVAVPDCLLQDPLLGDIAHESCRLLTDTGVRAYDETVHKGLLRHLFLRRSSKDGSVMLCLVLNGRQLPGEEAFSRAIIARFPQIRSLVVNTNTARTNVVLGDRCRTLAGEDVLHDALCGVPVRLSPLSFFQVNPGAAAVLYEKIAALAGLKPGDTLLDLYCGAGTIGLSMAGRCQKLIGVESVPGAVEDARRNAEALGCHHAEFWTADAGSAAQKIAASGTRIDVAVTDPPRKGCDAATLDALAAMAPRAIVMVSCNPATLARDLAALTAAGYRAGTVYPVDMFPRTKHVECVVLLTK